MLLSMPQTGEYAIRAMSCIAARDPEPVRAADLVGTTHIPAAYLSKVLRRLVEAGLLTSQKGHHGGFRLVRHPVEVRFVDILRAVGHDEGRARACGFGWAQCNAHAPCPLHPFYMELEERLLDWAARTTLADVDCTHLDPRSTEAPG